MSDTTQPKRRGRPKKTDPPRPPKAKSGRGRGRPPLATGPAPHRMSIRTNDEYFEWMKALARYDRLALVPELIDKALAHYAKAIGFAPPQPARRYRRPDE